MSEEPKTTVLTIAPSPMIAEVVKGMLLDAGIPAFTQGGNLADEVASAHQAFGNLGTRIFVPVSEFERATKLLEEAREAGRLMDEDPDRTPELDD